MDDRVRFQEKFRKELEGGEISEQTRFEYAYSLINSENRGDIADGVRLMIELLHDDPNSSRIYLFFIASGYFSLKQYEKAMEYVERLLRLEPNNAQARSLKSKIDDKMTTDGAIGMAIVGGAVAALGVAAVLLLKK